MSIPSFVYATIIATTPQRLWQALTSSEFTQQYWFARRIESEWRVGAPVQFFDGASDRLADDGVVLEYDPYRRLAYTFQPAQADASGERPGISRVTFTLEADQGVVKLILVHDEIPNETIAESLRVGWVAILSSLKTLLETGAPLPGRG